MSFEDIAIVDNHAHLLLRASDVAARPFGAFFTEAPFPVRETLFYRQALSSLAEFLGCAPDEASVVNARAGSDLYAQRLCADAHVQTLLLDDGYPREASLSLAETAALCGVRAHRVLRIESLAQDLIPRFDSLGELELAFIAALEAQRQDIVALKSVIAYRSGLALPLPAPAPAPSGL